MHPSMFLAPVLVFAIPTRVFATLAQPQVPTPALFALRAMQTPGAALGRVFDAAALAPAALVAPAFVPPAPGVEPPAPALEQAISWLLKKPERNGYDAIIRAEAARNRLDPRLVKSMIAAESGFRPQARSAAGAEGLMQLMPETAESVDVPRERLFDPAENVRAGARYLAYLFRRAWARYQLGDLPYLLAPEWILRRVVAAYNAGPRWLARRWTLRQTRDYVRKVMAFYRSRVSALSSAA